MMKDEIIQKIEGNRVIAIIRGVEPELCLRVARALYDGGIRLMEITFTQNAPSSFQQTAEAIRTLANAFEGSAEIGAGTVTSPALVDMAADAGAKFIISPDTNPAVISRTLERGLVSMPGAMTPTEILAAHNAGADYVKVFPAGVLGVDYIKAVSSPINHVKLTAVGGVSEANAAAFLKAGIVGLGVGGNLVNKKWIAAGEFEKLTQAAADLLAAIQNV